MKDGVFLKLDLDSVEVTRGVSEWRIQAIGVSGNAIGVIDCFYESEAGGLILPIICEEAGRNFNGELSAQSIGVFTVAHSGVNYSADVDGARGIDVLF